MVGRFSFPTYMRRVWPYSIVASRQPLLLDVGLLSPFTLACALPVYNVFLFATTGLPKFGGTEVCSRTIVCQKPPNAMGT